VHVTSAQTNLTIDVVEIVASIDDQGRVCSFTFADTHLTADVTGFTMG
jgi:hypothetical protein